jgi:hypothetical protein
MKSTRNSAGKSRRHGKRSSITVGVLSAAFVATAAFAAQSAAAGATAPPRP